LFCRKCGEKVQEGSSFCHLCGENIINQYSYKQTEDDGRKRTMIDANPDPINPFVRKERDNDGLLIPAEYTSDFDKSSFCWEAFWAFQYWYVIKGMTGLAIKYFLFGLLPLGTFFVTIHCGKNAYGEYSEYLNNTSSDEIAKARKSGTGCIIILILIGSLPAGVIWIILPIYLILILLAAAAA